GADPELAERAGRLAKVDLVSATVGEFPELQGVIGGRLAAAAGEPAEVAQAIAEHYRPLGPADAVPTAPLAAAVALADKLDSLAGFFAIGEAPTGSRDPFALRRAALGVVRILEAGGLRLGLRAVPGMDAALISFMAERLKVQAREAGIRHDLIDAAFATGDDDLVRLLARTRALQAFLASEDGANLLAAYRRAASILADEEKKDGRAHALDPAAPLSRYEGETEQALARLFHADAGSGAAPLPERIDALVEAEDFEGAMRTLATLRAPVDAFFERLMVNDPDPATRQRRLELLAGVRDAMHKVADFSRIEG
ncbi:MAG: glycine--tRNA ligase subunit beta, partial [Sphingomonadaceae bacterium]